VREKLNESKAAQVGLVAVLALVAAIFLLGNSGGSEGEAEGGSEGEPTTTVKIEATVPTSALSAAESSSAGMGELPRSVPGRPLPHRFTAAYDSGETVALLVVHDGGIDDAYTALALKEVAMIERVATIVVPAKQISRYASVTVGLDVNQVPALIVLRPKRLSKGVPQATVSYGYQTAESIYQTVRDASYVGPEVSYHPG
jgi:hypothetical protein